ncbi:hypothetical protein L915_15606 [Phytophthora nicotianae]|uniref:Uncharacterized protein n=1 Tax=Phytophthora nicotianae TaxID=4792 RepID=W2G815_PHYNI|nr:hypothetical protein L915_15606 [Phytophthora nicotianae]
MVGQSLLQPMKAACKLRATHGLYAAPTGSYGIVTVSKASGRFVVSVEV